MLSICRDWVYIVDGERESSRILSLRLTQFSMHVTGLVIPYSIPSTNSKLVVLY